MNNLMRAGVQQQAKNLIPPPPPPDFEAIYIVTEPDQLLTPMFRFQNAQITINWGDGSAQQVVNVNVIGAHRYAAPGLYTVKGTFTTLPTTLSATFQNTLALVNILSLNASLATNISFFLLGSALVESVCALETGSVLQWNNSFRNCPRLRCIGGLKTTSATITNDAFSGSPLLVAPASTGTPVRNVNAALAGGVWINPDPCP